MPWRLRLARRPLAGRRLLLAACALPLAGCNVPWLEPGGALLAANAAAIPVVHRDLFDVVYSVFTGRDCSIVRLDKSQSYCRPIEPPPVPPPFCTRSLGTVDCWSDPTRLPDRPPEVADGPRQLTPAQEEDRTARWPPI